MGRPDRARIFYYKSHFASTVNREIFVVKIFSDSTASAKIMRIINSDAVRGCLSENLFNTKIYHTKYL